MQLGSEALLASSRLNGLRVGVLANPASVGHDFRHVTDVLSHSNRYKLTAIFGPQHGYRSDLQDNMIETPHAKDRRRNVPIFSLYSETREPTKEMLDSSTCSSSTCKTSAPASTPSSTPWPIACAPRRVTAYRSSSATAQTQSAAVRSKGRRWSRGLKSFVGQFRMPMRHGMTIAELARLFNEHHGINAKLEIVPMEGWSRDMYWDATDLPWVMPSPNMPTLDTAIVYPGTVLYEGTMLSEGRGTTRPFELIGAPWLDGDQLAERMNKVGLKGVHFRGVNFEPTFQKHARATCGGCQIHVTSREDFLPVKAGVSLLRECYGSAPDRFQWRDPPYEYEHDKMPIDILAGSPTLRQQIESQVPLADIVASWRPGVAEFEEIRRNYLLY